MQFTVVDLAGIKQFNETVVAAEGRYDNSLQGMYWDGDRFKVVFVPGEAGALRSVDVGLNGAVLRVDAATGLGLPECGLSALDESVGTGAIPREQ